ncbi:MAG: xanthine dehydrogenase family protein molybdopterin-binding subunit [Pseudomonadota bacterium]|nr:xanthine dehydrogenase family protein molybdopterin-binding subunit [Pseudomonadota bacterium]
MAPNDQSPLDVTEKYAIGQPVSRMEDPVLLTGRGRYTDDINLTGQAYGVMVRSQIAHGVIDAIDLEEARAMPGVLAIYTVADMDAAGCGNLLCGAANVNRDGSPMIKPPRATLARERVRHVGDPIAFVVAETRAQARDAADAVFVDINPLPAVSDPLAAIAAGAPQIWPEAPGNIALDFHYGDSDAVAAAFAGAAHVTRLDLVNNRVVVSAMEPRVAVVDFDPAADKWTVRAGSQGVFGLHNGLAKLMNVAPEQVRVLTGNVGGSFGMKGAPYPEYAPMMHAARDLGRAIKWRDERSESFLSDHQGRASHARAELALDAAGKFLAVRVTTHADMGGYLTAVAANPQTGNIVKNVTSLYQVPLLEVITKCVFTTTTPTGPYRGAGRPEANYYMERLIDTAARELKIDAIELRRRNAIPAAAIPYKAASGLTYDSGDFPTIIDRTVAAADWDGFADRAAASRAKGLLRGRGFCSYLEVTGPPATEMGGLRFDEDGGVTIVTGTLDYGQGHLTPFAQLLSSRLGVPVDKVRLLQGDSDQLIAGGGTGGSKSAITSGGAIAEVADAVIEKGRQAAAHVLEAAVADIEFDNGKFEIAGTDRRVALLDLAATLRTRADLPADVPASLDTELKHEPGPSAFPNGAHVAEVEIDPATGVTRVVKYSAVDDFGTILNPMIVEGQVHGGVAQGLGQALLEKVVYDDHGQPLTGSYMDYAMPRADHMPSISLGFHAVPATSNRLGVKGCGEAGCSGALGAVMNAVVDALAAHGVRHIDMPATPEKVWRALNPPKEA